MASNKGKAPTRTDRAILEYLKNGGMINWETAFQKLGTNRLTDNIYRLRQDKNVIYDIKREYINDAGIQKHYFDYTMQKPLVLNAGQKVERQYSKSQTSAAEYADKIIESAKGHGAIQPELFS